MREVDCCAECGEPKEEHGHEFTPMFVPDHCTCEPRDWGNPLAIPAVCPMFVPLSANEPAYCKTCEHNETCHRAAK